MKRGRHMPGGRESGQSLAEFALLLPLLVVTLFALIDLARAMQSYVTIQDGAREGARYAVTGRIDCTGVSTQNRDNCIRQQVTNRVKSLNNASSITTSFRSWTYPSYADPATANSAGKQCDAVEISVSYGYKPFTPFFSKLFSNIPMKASERMINEPFGTCGT